MARREMTVERYEEIKRLLGLGLSLRKIAKSVQCNRRTIRQIRDSLRPKPGEIRESVGPPWSLDIDWEEISKEVLAGHPLKFIWEERAQERVSYVNFWRQFHCRFPEFGQETVVHRFFDPADRCEVDYAGDTVEWMDIKKGKARKAYVFVGILGFSQLLFACAREEMKRPRFLECHNKMFAAFGGVPKTLVPDCLKQGVAKTHLFDPDINEAYRDLAKHYGTAIVPARPARPKDKALIEGAVKIVMQRFKWKYRSHSFVSIPEIDAALALVCEEINRKPHTRFKISRYDRWQQHERPRLKALPPVPFEIIEWKEAKLHPDSYLSVEGNFYSAPHIYRGEILKVKITPSHVEVFRKIQRVAFHCRRRQKEGRFVTQEDHLPPNARAYHEATPQRVLAQAKYLNPDLHHLLDTLFQENALGHLRRAQGFVREARNEINAIGAWQAGIHIQKAMESMTQYNKIRVPYFRELLNRFRIEQAAAESASIQRKSGNTMLRYTNPTAFLQ